MASHESTGKPKGGNDSHFVGQVRRAFAEFLMIPTLVIIAFLLLAVGAYHLDRLRIEHNWPTFVFGSEESISTLLGTIATSIITVTSITFSLLLIAVQQSAAALTGQVYDQFLRRRANQAYFGIFVGLALYCLIILATVQPDYTPIYGATVAFALTVVALYLLILLIYSTIDQMRPVAIIRNIRDYALSAREAQQEMLSMTRERPLTDGGASARLCAAESGYITAIDVRRIEQLRRDHYSAGEIVLLRPLGDYVSIGEELIEVRQAGAPPDNRIGAQLLSVVRLERRRDLGSDPGFGIEQMANIAWTTVSTSKQNPEPGKLVCRSFRDLVAHWYGEGAYEIERGGAECRIVVPDNVPADLIRGFETLAVVASESMQHHTLSEVYRALALALDRSSGQFRADVEALVMRSLSMLADNPLTAELDESIARVATALPPGATRTAIERARDRLAQTHGILNSRSSRVQNPLGQHSGS